MSFFDVHAQALEECGGQAHKVKNMLDPGDAFLGTSLKAPEEDIDSGVFGDVEGAAALAAKVDQVWASVRDELGAGRNRMEGVERALNDVATNFRGAERAAKA